MNLKFGALILDYQIRINPDIGSLVSSQQHRIIDHFELKSMAGSKSVIADLKRSHYHQRIQQELTFETTPRDSRYSNGLLELMKREEQIVKDCNYNASKVIIQKVDEALRSETQQFFAKSAFQNVKRWVTLKDKFNVERQQMLASANNLNDNDIANSIEVEAERLELDYNSNWFLYENYNLQQAFRSQTSRVENDWQCHEASLAEEFRARKEKLMGTSGDGNQPLNNLGGNSHHHDQRWQHPEKQKTLIHTAPVLTPTRQQDLVTEVSMGDGGGRWNRGKKDLEVMFNALTCWQWLMSCVSQLDRLERELQSSIESLERQKADAKRWLLRQQVRLQAQAEEVQREKLAVAELLAAEFADFQQLRHSVSGNGGN